MRTNFIAVLFSLILLTGCITTTGPAPVTVSVPVEFEASVPDRLLDLWDVPVLAAIQDEDCSKAYWLAKKAVIDQLPPNASAEAVDKALTVDHRMIGVWYSDTGWCGVYDILNIPRSNTMLSPHEVFDEQLSKFVRQENIMSISGHNKFKQWYVRINY